MRRPLLWLVVGVLPLATTASSVATVSPARPTGSSNAPQRLQRTEPEFNQQTLLVRFRPGIDRSLRRQVVLAHDASQLGAVPGTGYVLVDTRGQEPTELADELDGDSRVSDVQLNFLRRAATEPDDPYFSKGIQPYLETIRLPQAWSVSQGGSDGAIAILDSGVDLDHPELDSRVLPGRDFVNDDGDAQDDDGHGTLVAGIAAAETNNDLALAGSAWEAQILPVKVLGEHGIGHDADIAAGITWAADNGASVINLSFAGPGDSPVLRQAVEYALAKDALVVAAAGNTGVSEPQYPAAYEGVVAVAATDWVGNALAFSAHGPWVDLAAPGRDLISTQLTPSAAGWYALGRLDPVTGTSFSTALVSGVAHLIRSEHPGWSAARVADRLRLSATDLGPPGIDDTYGAGLVDAYRALGGPPPPAIAPPRGDWRANDAPTRAFMPTPSSSDRRLFSTGPHETIAPHGETDWFAFDSPEATDVGVGLTPEPVPLTSGGTDYRLELFDSDLRLLARTDQFGVEGPEGATGELDRPGRFYARVTAVTGSVTNGAYELRARLATQPSTDRIRGFLYPEWHPEGMERPYSVAVADVTADGRKDVIGTDSWAVETSALVVYPQISDGWLGRPIRMHLGSRYTEAALGTADFDGDGLTDVAAVTAEGVKIYRAEGEALGTPELVPGSSGAEQLEAADFDADGRTDLALLGPGIRILHNTPSGWTHSQVADDHASEIEAGDVTGDGRADLVAAVYLYSHAWQVHVFAQSSTGAFLRRASGPVTMLLKAVAIGDVTGDGRNDVVAADRFEDKLFVHPQTATGVLGTPKSYLVRGVDAVETADVNADGRIDVVTGGNWAGVLLQQADGTLGPFQWWGFGHTVAPKGLVIDDVTSDGAPDLVFADQNSGIAVHRRRTARWPLPEWVRDTTPADLAAGVPATEEPRIRFARAVNASSVSPQTVRLLDGHTGARVPAAVAYDSAARAVVLRSEQQLAPGPYAVRVADLEDESGNRMLAPYTYRFTVGPAPVDSTPPDTVFRDPFAGAVTKSGSTRWRATEPGARFECWYEGWSTYWSMCGEIWDSSVPSNANEATVRVRAIDAAGNVDPTPAARTFVADRSRPPPSNDNEQDAETLAGESGRAVGSTVHALYGSCRIGGFWLVNDVFYRWTAPNTRAYTFDTNGSSFDTILGVYNPVSQDCKSAHADDDSGEGFQSEVTFQFEAGTTYIVVVAGFSTQGPAAEGDIVLNWHPARGGPENLTAPTVSGTTRAGGPLSATQGTWTGNPEQYLFQWRRCDPSGSPCRNVAGATSLTYRLGAVDAGSAMRVAVTALAAERRATAQSDATSPVVGPPTVVSGKLLAFGGEAARVKVRVRPNGLETNVHVVFGATSDYGQATPSVTIPASFTWSELEFELRGVLAGETYHFRAKALNADGAAEGEDEVFATSEPSPPVPPPVPPTPSPPPASMPPPAVGGQALPPSPQPPPPAETALPRSVPPSGPGSRPDVVKPSARTTPARLRLLVVSRNLSVSRSGLAAVRLRCPPAALRFCRGTVRLVSVRPRLIVARRKITARAGQVVAVRLRVAPRVLRALNRARAVRVRLAFTGRDGAGRPISASQAVFLFRRR